MALEEKWETVEITMTTAGSVRAGAVTLRVMLFQSMTDHITNIIMDVITCKIISGKFQSQSDVLTVMTSYRVFVVMLV